MATADSYQRQQGATVLVSEKKQFSYKAGGPAPLIIEKKREAYHRVIGIGTLDSTVTAILKVQNAVQRTDENIVDVSGLLYRTGSYTSVVLNGVQYSAVDYTGPFTSINVLTSDPAYNWPVGDASGQAFNLPVEFSTDPGTSLWWKVIADYSLASPVPTTGLWAWWDASQITGLNDGDAVTTWGDASGNGRWLRRRGDTAGPQYKTNIVNSKPVVRYTSTPFSWHEIGPFTAVTQPRTFITVSYSNKLNAYIMDGNVVGQYLDILYHWTTGHISARASNGTFLSSNQDDRGAWKYCTIMYNDPSNSIMRVNGVEDDSNSIGTISHTGYTVGCHHGRTSALGLEGDIAEILVYDHVLSAGDITTVETYLANKYNL